VEVSAKIDSRLVPEALSSAGLAPDDAESLRVMLAELITGRRSSPAAKNFAFIHGALLLRADVSLELHWDGIVMRVVAERELPVAPVLEKYSRSFDEAIQQKLKFETGRSLLALDEKLRAGGTSLDEIRQGKRNIDAAAARILMDYYFSSFDRVIHEEIAGLLVKPVKDKLVRGELARFALSQFPIPAKRVHRFTLCQALENLAEPEFAWQLSALALDPRNDSLRGRLCMALARTKVPDAVSTITRVLEDGDDETKVWAIEALATINATDALGQIEKYRTYQSSDKEWTRAINKAAEKALKSITK